ncbi:MAG: hypothetical protein U0736_24480 [Gemmataceae bacterium]
MILLVCVLLFLASVGLVIGPNVLARLADIRLQLTGQRVRVPARRIAAGDRRLAFPSRQGGPPPVRVHTRVRPAVPCPTPSVPPHG